MKRKKLRDGTTADQPKLTDAEIKRAASMNALVLHDEIHYTKKGEKKGEAYKLSVFCEKHLTQHGSEEDKKKADIKTAKDAIQEKFKTWDPSSNGLGKTDFDTHQKEINAFFVDLEAMTRTNKDGMISFDELMNYKGLNTQGQGKITLKELTNYLVAATNKSHTTCGRLYDLAKSFYVKRSIRDKKVSNSLGAKHFGQWKVEDTDMRPSQEQTRGKGPRGWVTLRQGPEVYKRKDGGLKIT
jgi:hypothetical protein